MDFLDNGIRAGVPKWKNVTVMKNVGNDISDTPVLDGLLNVGPRRNAHFRDVHAGWEVGRSWQ